MNAPSVVTMIALVRAGESRSCGRGGASFSTADTVGLFRVASGFRGIRAVLQKHMEQCSA